MRTARVVAPPYTVLTRAAADAEREATVYIKGFLAQGETHESFAAWFRAHMQLALLETHRWGPLCAGHTWQSGVFNSLSAFPLPVATIASGLLLALRRTPLRWATPAALAGVAGADLVQIAGRLAYQYWLATHYAHEQADDLAQHLLTLRTRHDRVRLVAHSLGCRHAIVAVAAMTPAERPDVLHLNAAAMRESECTVMLDGLARHRTFVYYSRDDSVLSTAFYVLSGGTAIGQVGLTRPYAGLTALDVAKHFRYFVHTAYADRFARFAAPDASPAPAPS